MPIILTVLLTAVLGGCSPQDQGPSPRTERPETPGIPEDPTPPTANTMQITINGRSFSATLTDNAAARAFQTRFPMTISMGELNGNEKYHYLSTTLPTSAINPGTIQSGELMLFGSDCLVLFYKTFSTYYNYTRIGRINNSEGLSAAVGSGSVSVKFEHGE